MGGLEKARLVSQENASDYLLLHYNPATITMTTGAKWAPPTGRRAVKGAPPSEFSRADPVTYRMDVVLDSVDDPKRKVPDAIIKLVDWTRSTPASIGNETPSPPLLVLEWGKRHWGPLHITRLRVDHTLFDSRRHPGPRQGQPADERDHHRDGSDQPDLRRVTGSASRPRRGQ